MKRFIWVLAAAAVLISSCMKEEIDAGKVEVIIRAEGMSSKSSLDVDENKIVDLNVYAYCGGVLYFDGYSQGESVKLLLDGKREYTIYLLANSGKVAPTYKESEMDSMKCDFVYKREGALPMCLSEGRKIRVGGTATMTYTFSLTRLVSKYTVSLKDLLEECRFEARSARILQEASCVYPFAYGSAAHSVVDGDSASETDIAALNRGECVDFYVLENCQGLLLEGNDDPWKKEPSSIPEKAHLCSYLELAGNWTTGGAEADLNLRFYLGGDNVADFNVVRNTNVRIELYLSDSGTLKYTWKSSLDNMDDRRTLRFKSYNNYIYQEDGWTEVPVEVYPSNMTFRAQMEGRDMECKVSQGKVYVRGLYDGDEYREGNLALSSWDGAHNASARVSLRYRPQPFTAYEARMPQCIGEYGYITFDKVEHPVIISTSGPVWNIDDGSITEPCEYEDPQSGDRLYYFPSSRTLHIYRSKVSGTATISIRSFKSSKSFSLGSAYYPELRLNDGFVSEAGCHNVLENGKYYDSHYTAGLLYEDGSVVPMSRFKMPQEVLLYKGLDEKPSNYYKTFDEVYGVPMFTTTAPSDKAVFMPPYNSPDARYEYFDDTDMLYENTAFGLKALPDTDYECTFALNGCHLKKTALVHCVKAFPSQRNLGEIHNYQVAPSTLRKDSVPIDFTEGGKYDSPARYLVNWEVRHTMSDGSLSAAFSAGSNDIYSQALSIKENEMSFKKMSSDVFPSCGSMVLKGTVKNPHTGATFTGYYRFDLVLFVSIGCQFDFVYPSTPFKIGISYVPFCEYSTKALASQWNDNMPDFLQVRSHYKSTAYSIKVPSKANENQWYESNADFTPRPIVQDAMKELAPYKAMFDFEFVWFFGSGNEHFCTRSGFQDYPAPEMKAYSDGRKGYYHFVRQCDLANFAPVETNCGLDNYLIEAAYGSVSKY